MILGFAKKNGIYGIGMYGELNEPEIPQYRAAISIIKTLEKLTYRKFGDTSQLEFMAQEIDRKFKDKDQWDFPVEWGSVFSSWQSQSHRCVSWLFIQSIHSKCFLVSHAAQIILLVIISRWIWIFSHLKGRLELHFTASQKVFGQINIFLWTKFLCKSLIDIYQINWVEMSI